MRESPARQLRNTKFLQAPREAFPRLTPFPWGDMNTGNDHLSHCKVRNRLGRSRDRTGRFGLAGSGRGGMPVARPRRLS